MTELLDMGIEPTPTTIDLLSDSGEELPRAKGLPVTGTSTPEIEQSYTDLKRKVISPLDNDPNKKVAESYKTTTLLELTGGPNFSLADVDIGKLASPEMKKRFYNNLKEVVAKEYLRGQLKKLDSMARYNVPDKNIETNDFVKHRQRILDYVDTIMEGEGSEKELKYLLGLTYKGLHIPKEELHAWGTAMNFALSKQIRGADNDWLDVYSGKGGEEINTMVDGVLNTFIPEYDQITFSDGLTDKESKNLVTIIDHYATAMDKAPEVIEALKIKKQYRTDEYIRKITFTPMKHVDGEIGLQTVSDTAFDAVKNVYDDLFGEGGKRNVDWDKANKALIKTYGSDWQEQFGVFVLSFMLPQKAVSSAGTKMATWGSKALAFGDKKGMLAGEAALRLLRKPSIMKSAVVNYAETAATIAGEHALRGGALATTKQHDEDYFKTHQVATDIILGGAAGAGLFGMLHLTRAGGNKVWKTADNIVKNWRKEVGDMMHVSPVEQLGMESAEVVKTLRKQQLGIADKSTGLKEVAKLDNTGFDTILQVANETQGLPSNKLGLSAGGHLEFLRKIDSVQEGQISVYLQGGGKGLFMGQDALENEVGNILTKHSNAGRAVIEKLDSVTFGKVGLQLLTGKSQAVDQLVKRFAKPLRRTSENILTRTTKLYNDTYKKVKDIDTFSKALMYSDQKEKLLNRAELGSMFSLSDNDTKQYYKLHRFFKRLWTDQNNLEADKLTSKGFKAISDNLDGYGQQSIVKERKLGRKFFSAESLDESYDELSPQMKTAVDVASESEEVSAVSILRKLKDDNYIVVENHLVDKSMPRTFRVVPKEKLVDVDKVVGYNPGFFGGVRYDVTPDIPGFTAQPPTTHVIALNRGMYKSQAKGVTDNPTNLIQYIGGSRHFADSQKAVNRLKGRWDKKGYDLIPVRSDRGTGDIRAALPEEVIDGLGTLDEGQAQIIAKHISDTLDLSDTELSNLMEALLRPSLAPHLRSRGKMLRNFGAGRGREVFKKNGESILRKDLLPILGPKDAGIDYIQKYAKTITTGNFRSVLKNKFIAEFGDAVIDDAGRTLKSSVSGFNIFGPLRPRTQTGLGPEKYAHALAVQELLKRLYITPSKTNTKLRNLFQQQAERYAQKDNPFFHQVSKIYDELGIDARYNPLTPRGLGTIKGTGTHLAFLANAAVGVQQLAPALLSVLRHPTDIGGITKDTIGLMYGTLMRSMKLPGKGLPRRLKIREKELYDSFILGEMRHLEELGDIGQAFRDFDMAFFYTAEGIGRTTAFATTRREITREFKLATKLASNKNLPEDKAKWLTWIDDKGKLTKEGLFETTYRADKLYFSMTREEAPQLSLGYAGMVTQFFANVTAHTASTFYTHANTSIGKKLKYALGTTALFGPTALPFSQDIFNTIHSVSKVFDSSSNITQKEESQAKMEEMLSGYLAEEFELDPEIVSRTLKGGIAGYSVDQQWNITNRFFTGAILSNFISNNIRNTEVLMKGLRLEDPGMVGQGVSGLAGPAPKIMYKNLTSVSDGILAVMQAYDKVHPTGQQDSIRRAIRKGNDEGKLEAEMDNIKYQFTKDLPGLGNLLAFFDTYGVNFTGEEVWRDRGAKTLDSKEAFETRLKLLTGLGPAYREQTFELSALRWEKVEAIKLRGREIADQYHKGNVDAAQANLQQQITTLQETDPLLLQYLIPAYVEGLTRPLYTDKAAFSLEKVKGVGKVASPLLEK